MNPDTRRILDHLETVERLRKERESDPALGRRVDGVKAYQALRFQHTYADLLASTRYAAAARFFLDELYGAHDFCERDAQFARVVPAMTRMLPAKLLDAVVDLAELHSLTETMDTCMGLQIDPASLDALAYARAWQACEHRDIRQAQIQKTLRIGKLLDKYTGNRLIRGTLRVMRGPAQAAGLGQIQRILESGLDAFESMRGADDFLDIIRVRETELMDVLFGAELGKAGRQAAGGNGGTVGRMLALLPADAP
jgi:hypothetical protein